MNKTVTAEQKPKNWIQQDILTFELFWTRNVKYIGEIYEREKERKHPMDYIILK